MTVTSPIICTESKSHLTFLFSWISLNMGRVSLATKQTALRPKNVFKTSRIASVIADNNGYTSNLLDQDVSKRPILDSKEKLDVGFKICTLQWDQWLSSKVPATARLVSRAFAFAAQNSPTKANQRDCSDNAVSHSQSVLSIVRPQNSKVTHSKHSTANEHLIYKSNTCLSLSSHFNFVDWIL